MRVLDAALTIDLLQLKLNRAMQDISRWRAAHWLTLALNNTEVVITKKRIPTILPLRVGNATIETKAAANFLCA